MTDLLGKNMLDTLWQLRPEVDPDLEREQEQERDRHQEWQDMIDADKFKAEWLERDQ